MYNLVIFTGIIGFVCLGGAWLAFHTPSDTETDEKHAEA